MKRIISVMMILMLATLSIAYTTPDKLPIELRHFHTNGSSYPGQFEMNFSIYNDSSRSKLIGSEVETITFDANGIAGIYLDISDDFNEDTWLCIEDTGTDNQSTDCMQLGSVPYAKYTDFANDFLGNLNCTRIVGNGSDSDFCSDLVLTQEQVEDFAGAMWTGNTETGITITYQDGDGTIDAVVDFTSVDECSEITNCVPNAWDADADIPADGISEGKIALTTACGSGNHLYVSGNDFACEADDDEDDVDTAELDNLCSTDGKILKRVGGTWVCSDDATGAGGAADIPFWISSADSWTESNASINSGRVRVTNVLNVTGFSTGSLLSSEFDAHIGVDYGIIRIGDSYIGHFGETIGGMDLNGTVVLGNQDDRTSSYEFLFGTSDNNVRLVIPKAGVDYTMYNPRSSVVGGDLGSSFNNNLANCTAQGYDFIDCDTSGTGADFGVQDDVEVRGSMELEETLNFYGELKPDGVTCVDGDGVVKVGTDNFECIQMNGTGLSLTATDLTIDANYINSQWVNGIQKTDPYFGDGDLWTCTEGTCIFETLNETVLNVSIEEVAHAGITSENITDWPTCVGSQKLTYTGSAIACGADLTGDDLLTVVFPGSGTYWNQNTSKSGLNISSTLYSDNNLTITSGETVIFTNTDIHIGTGSSDAAILFNANEKARIWYDNSPDDELVFQTGIDGSWTDVFAIDRGLYDFIMRGSRRIITDSGNLTLQPVGPLVLKPSGDTDDYLQIETGTNVTDVPVITVVGGNITNFLATTGNGWMDAHFGSVTEHTEIYTGTKEQAKTDILDWTNGIHPSRMGSTTPVLVNGSVVQMRGTNLGVAGKATAKVALDNTQRLDTLIQDLCKYNNKQFMDGTRLQLSQC